MAEAAGLVLAVVPILAATIKQYGTLHKMCKRFRKCNECVEELTECLRLQRVIFINETKLLLIGTVGVQNAKTMVQDLHHPLWQDSITSSQLSKLLGESEEAVFLTANKILEKMSKMENEINKVTEGSGTCQDGKEWRKLLRNKFKFAVSDDRIKALSSSISTSTAEYRTLRAQVQELGSHQPDEMVDPQASRELKRVQATQTAAKRVYEVLANACKLHTRHHAQFSLRPIYTSSITDITDIRFQIAYRHIARQQRQDSEDALWFIVESKIEASLAVIPSVISPALDLSKQKSIKRPVSPNLSTIAECISQQPKRVRFRSPSPIASPRAKQPVINVAPPTVTTTLLELGSSKDFCTQLRTGCKGKHDQNNCIGELKDVKQSRYKVYQCPSPVSSASPNTQASTKTLATLLEANDSGRNGQKLSLLQRLRLARLLSLAILNYHSTPWVRPSWTSRDIVLYNTDSHSRTATVSDELEAYVETPVQQLPSSVDDQTDPYELLAPWVRNSTVFSLGVMLLELAFEQPLSKMQKPCDRQPGLPMATVDLHTALRQSREVSGCLGIKYAQIVEKCLYCDFGQGSELSNPALQDAIHRNVVQEITRLEAGFKLLGIS